MRSAAPIRAGDRFTTPQGYDYTVTAIGRGRFLALNGDEYIFTIADWDAGKFEVVDDQQPKGEDDGERIPSNHAR